MAPITTKCSAQTFIIRRLKGRGAQSLISNTTLWRSLILVLTFGSSTSLAETPQPVIGQYIRIELPGVERTLSLAEVRVYSRGNNIALQGKAKQASTFAGAVAARAVDGNSAGHYFDRSVTSTLTQPNPWWELDLGYERPITEIIILNRTDCCMNRINPARVMILDRNKQIAWEENINATAAQYKFVPVELLRSIFRTSPNLLPNSTFQQRTNGSIPDYWDLHHVAALTFRNLHHQYGIDDSNESPVPGAAVLRIENSETNFPYLNLMPRKFFSPLPDGEYTFSVYLKCDKDGMEYHVSRAWAEGETTARKLTTTWVRYSVTFRISRKSSDTLQPVMFFPSNGTYYVSAPQLERGNAPSPFEPSPDNEVSESSMALPKQQLKDLPSVLTNAISKTQSAPLSASFEYSYYTSQETAHLELESQYGSEVSALIKCANSSIGPLIFPIHIETIIRPSSSKVVDVPIAEIPLGDYTCLIETVERSARQALATAKFTKLASGPVEVRINNLRRYITINDKPFFMMGIGVGSWKIPPDWYFRDIAARGINTVFHTGRPHAGIEYDVGEVEAFLSGAARYGLKAIIGLPLAGSKVPDWRQRLNGFTKLILNLKQNPTIIGWYPVDEPAAKTWTDDELLEIYNVIKDIDPHRLIFINWAYDGVPSVIGQQPRGTLSATDVYSIDYYPFAGQGRSMEGFTGTAVRALATARIHKKISHSWIQIYGGMDAWREPTGDEIKYMTYVNLVYGGTISYWDTKSNSAATWEKLSAINRDAKILAEELFLNPEAREIVPPVAKNNFLYSMWQKGKRTFLIVSHNGDGPEMFTYEPGKLIGGYVNRAKSLFEKIDVSMTNGQIREPFRSFESKVYVLE